MNGMSKVDARLPTLYTPSHCAQQQNMWCSSTTFTTPRTNELLKFQKTIYVLFRTELRLCSDFNYKFHEILYTRTMSPRRDDI